LLEGFNKAASLVRGVMRELYPIMTSLSAYISLTVVMCSENGHNVDSVIGYRNAE
jgi:hypothetical protein